MSIPKRAVMGLVAEGFEIKGADATAQLAALRATGIASGPRGMRFSVNLTRTGAARTG